MCLDVTQQPPHDDEGDYGRHDESEQDHLATDTEVTRPPAKCGSGRKTSSAAIERDWAHVRTLALKQLDRFMSFEPAVLKGDDPDAIHDMRVASRRLQQVLDLIYPKPRPKEIRQLRRQIQHSRRSLGGVRNADVLLDRVDRVLARKRAAHSEAWTAVHDYLRESRSRTYSKGLRKLSRVNLTVFYVRLKECLNHSGPVAVPAHLPHNGASTGVPVLEPLPERVGQALEVNWAVFQEQVERSQHDPRPSAIHGVRIAAKKLRYLLEVVREFDVPGGAESLAWLRKLQKHLGNWHDLEVLEQMMIRMVARPDYLAAHLTQAMEVERLILQNRKIKKGYKEKYFRIMRKAAEFQRVKDWVGYLIASPSAAFAKD